ncbi:MAG: hypothetical protein ACYDCC_03530 [Actinomycetota bacterium]
MSSENEMRSWTREPQQRILLVGYSLVGLRKRPSEHLVEVPVE